MEVKPVASAGQPCRSILFSTVIRKRERLGKTLSPERYFCKFKETSFRDLREESLFVFFERLKIIRPSFHKCGLTSNITIKHRHLGVNLVFTSQNPKSIPNIIRNNIDVYVLYKFANLKMVIDKIFEEVSGLLTEQQFE